jgi:phospholipid transport system substrate-binding protein
MYPDYFSRATELTSRGLRLTSKSGLNDVSGWALRFDGELPMTRLSLHRRNLLIAALLGAAGLALPAQAADTSSAVAPIQALYNELTAVMRAGQGTPFAQRYSMLAPVIEKTFDLNEILQVSVGPSWTSMTPDQKSMLQAAFKHYTVASYVNSFDSFGDQKFVIAPQTRSLPSGEQVVDSRIVPRHGDTHVLDYVMRQTPQGWQVVDVLLDGTISRVAVQRSDFRSLLASGGAVALAKSLREKSADLSGGVG